MSTSLLFQALNIRDYQYASARYSNGFTIWNIISKNFRCNNCSSPNVSVRMLKERVISAGNICRLNLLLNVAIHRIYCFDCKKDSIENISFLPTPKARITKSLERTKVELCSMSETEKAVRLLSPSAENLSAPKQ